MTDEEKAAEYADKFCRGCNRIHCNINIECFSHESTRLTYLAGLEEGRKEKWHNLEENPNDLPIYDKNVLVKYIIEDIECISISFCYGYNKWSQPLGLATDRDGYYYDYKILSWKEID